LVRELEIDLGLQKKATQELKVRLALPLPVSPSIESSIHVRAPAWWRRMSQRRTHLIFLRELAQESVSLPPFVHTYRSLRS
jgi:hypothetical protein